MKRTSWILMLILVILAAISIFFLISRQRRAASQSVHPDCKAILSISIAKIAMDNWQQLFSGQNAGEADSSTNLLTIKNLWNSGLSIPSQAHFFSMDESPFIFYSIFRIRDAQKWASFLAEYAQDSTVVMNDSPSTSFVRLTPHMDAIYDQNSVLLRITWHKQTDIIQLKNIWSDMDYWIPVKDIEILKDEHPIDHIRYRQVDGSLILSAKIFDGHSEIHGNWQLKNPVDKPLSRRKTDMDKLFLSFWNTLPLAEIPLFTDFLSTYTNDIIADSLSASCDGYMDMFISSETSTQHDTIIVYDYDENFNSIEKKEIQEIHVPMMESVWKGNQQLATLLPDKLYYTWNKTVTDSVVLLSTATPIEFQPIFSPTSSPFRLSIDCNHMPNSWSGTLSRSLKQRNMNLDIVTAMLDHHTLEITGRVNFIP